MIDFKETPLFGDRDHTCVLNAAARGSKTLEEIGRLLDISRERVRQIEAEALVRLRDSNAGVLRDLLDGLNEIENDGEPWEDDEHHDLRSQAPDPEDSEEPTTDDTGIPEDAESPVTDDTARLPWSETSSTDPAVQAVNRRRLERATARASEAKPYWCPSCGRTYPGVNVFGHARRGCPNPRCAGKAWGQTARAKGTRNESLDPRVAAAILADYQRGVRGYKTLAREHNLSRAKVQRFIRTQSHQEEA